MVIVIVFVFWLKNDNLKFIESVLDLGLNYVIWEKFIVCVEMVLNLMYL